MATGSWGEETASDGQWTDGNYLYYLGMAGLYLAMPGFYLGAEGVYDKTGAYTEESVDTPTWSDET